MSEQPKSRFKGFWLLLTAAILVSTALQLATLMKWSVWHDEGYTAMLVDYPLGEMVERTALDVHPPLYYIVLKGWLALTGDSLFTARLFSVICMVAAAGATILFIRRFYSERYATWAALPIALGPMLIRYGQEMRMYGWAALLAIAATWLFMSLLERSRGSPAFIRSSRGRLMVVGYGLLIATLFYSHYFAGGLLLPLHFIVLLSDWFSRGGNGWQLRRFLRTYRWWIWGSILALLLFLPWLPTFADQVNSVKDGFWIRAFSASSLFSTIAATLFFRPEWIEWRLETWYGVMALVGMGLTVWFLIRWWQKADIQPTHKVMLGGYLAIPVLIMMLVSLPRPILQTTSFYYDRYFATFTPMFYAFIGISLAELWHTKRSSRLKSKLVTGCFLVFAGFGLYNTQVIGNNFGHRSDDYFAMRPLYQKLDSLRRPSELVVGDNLGIYFDLRYYLTRDGHAEPLLLTEKPWYKYGNSSLIYDRDDLFVKNLDALPGNSFWFVGPSSQDMEETVGPNWQSVGMEVREGYAKFAFFVRR